MAGQGFHIRIGDRAHQVRIDSVTDGAARVLVDGRALEVRPGPGGALLVRDLGEGAGHAHTLVTLDGQAWPEAAHVRGHSVSLEVKTAQEAARESALAAAGGGSGAAAQVKAPMPGRVVRVLVREGDPVDRGAPVIIVEAMKMENELAAAAAGSIKRLLVAEGDRVEAGQLLCELELATAG